MKRSTPSALTRRPFPNVSELQRCEDGVVVMPRRRDAVFMIIRGSTQFCDAVVRHRCGRFARRYTSCSGPDRQQAGETSESCWFWLETTTAVDRADVDAPRQRVGGKVKESQARPLASTLGSTFSTHAAVFFKGGRLTVEHEWYKYGDFRGCRRSLFSWW